MNTKQLLRAGMAVCVSVIFLGCASKMEVASDVNKLKKPDYAQGVVAYNNRHFDRALDIWVEVANHGDPQAINALGMMYQSGRGVARDVGTAARLYKKAAKAGLASAQNNLAVLYEGGEGVPQDLVRAVDLYRRAAAQGYTWAQYNLGRLHASGSGVKKSAALANDFFIKADESRAQHKDTVVTEPNR